MNVNVRERNLPNFSLVESLTKNTLTGAKLHTDSNNRFLFGSTTPGSVGGTTTIQWNSHVHSEATWLFYSYEDANSGGYYCCVGIDSTQYYHKHQFQNSSASTNATTTNALPPFIAVNRFLITTLNIRRSNVEPDIIIYATQTLPNTSVASSMIDKFVLGSGSHAKGSTGGSYPSRSHSHTFALGNAVDSSSTGVYTSGTTSKQVGGTATTASQFPHTHPDQTVTHTATVSPYSCTVIPLNILAFKNRRVNPIHANMIVPYIGKIIPKGWVHVSNLDGRFPLASNSYGSKSGNPSASHGEARLATASVTGPTLNVAVTNTGSRTSIWGAHYHHVELNAASACNSWYPPYYSVNFIQKT